MSTPTTDIEHDSDTDSFSVVSTHDGQPIITIAGPHKASDKELCQRIADEINSGRLRVLFASGSHEAISCDHDARRFYVIPPDKSKLK